MYAFLCWKEGMQCCFHLALPPIPFPAFQCCTLKRGRAWYAKSRVACHDDQSWRGMRMKSRLIKVNKTRLFLCYPCLLSSINVWFEPSKDRLLLVKQWYSSVSYHLLAVVLTSPVTFDLRDGLDLLSPLSISDFAYQALSVQHWKAGSGPGDKASFHQELIRERGKTVMTCKKLLNKV